MLSVVGVLMVTVVAGCALGQEVGVELTREGELPVEQPTAQKTRVALPTVTPEAPATAAQTPTTAPVATLEQGTQSGGSAVLSTPTPEPVTVERLLGVWISPLELPEEELMSIPWASITFPPQRPGRAILAADDANQVEEVSYELQGNLLTFHLAAGDFTYAVVFEADEMTLTSEGASMIYCKWAPHPAGAPTCPHWPMGEQ